MRTVSVLALLAVLGPSLAHSKEEDPLPPPPTTPLPAFENPLHDAKVGETLRYRVMDLESGSMRYYEERVLARKEERVCLETVETDETGVKVFSTDPQRSGWRAAPATFKLPAEQSWKKDKQKDVLLGVGPAGKPPVRSVRCTMRVLDEPELFADPTGRRRERKIWYSHDVPCSGKAKEWPAQNDGERLAISWDRTMTPAECEERARKYRDSEEEKKKDEEAKEKEKEGKKDGEKPPEGGDPKPPEGGEPKPPAPAPDETGKDVPKG